MQQIAISAGHDLTADTALDVLKMGGNAVDAAIAAFLVAWIAEPCMASGGAGAFANIFMQDGQSVLFDFFAQTPLKKKLSSNTDFFPIEVDFGDSKEVFHIGKASIAVPGSIAGIFAMHQQFGTIPMKELVQPAMIAAKEGVIINDFQAYDIELLRPIFANANETKSNFHPNGDLIKKGELLRLPRLVDFLDYMSREGKDAFYKGEIAKKIEEDHLQGGGFLTREDLANYKVVLRKPLVYSYNGKTILSNPYPSVGGSKMIHLLKLLNTNNTKENPLGKLHLECLYEAFKKSSQWNPQEIAASLVGIARNSSERLTNKHGSTSHFNIVDKWGNAVSLTTTIGEGSSYFVPGTDIHMNNMLGEAALLPDGFHSWVPDTRLSSMMAPTIVLDENKKVEIVTGSGGASRIPSAIMQVLHYLLDYNLSLKEAVNFPRVHLEHQVFNMELGFEDFLQKKEINDNPLAWTKRSLFFGGAHTILRKGNRYFAEGDSRRDGVARV